jgi:glycyl-tRNA synthetase beta chain
VDILLEIGLEEIPARFLIPALNDIEKIITKNLNDSRIKFDTLKTYGTPRRLVLHIENMVEKQDDLEETNIGPSKSVAYNDDGVATKACMGFAKSQGVEVSDLEIIETDKGEYVGVKKFVEGKETKDLLPSILKELVEELSFPKSMKWSNKKFRFARPVRWFLALCDTDLIEFEIEGIKSDKFTRGHRFFGENEIQISTIAEYFEKLKENNVIISIEDRKKMIVEQIEKRCTEANEKVRIEEALLEEVANLVEYPYPIVGSFNTEFLEVPQDVLIISMQVHQRYFPILDENGKLLPKFVVVRNGIEDSEDVRKGNETVIGARLSDARFFFNEDLKKNMEDFVESLKTVVFQKDLGTIFEKVERSKKLASYMVDGLNKTEKLESVLRTVHLAKADLMSNMIGEKEFTKLQGFMGNVYALKAGEKEEVALGIEEHYLPRYHGDSLPTTFEGAITGIADKIDTLVGCFGIGLIPSGSKDPYALRRAALGIVNVIMNSELNISLVKLVGKSIEIYEKKNILKREREEVISDVMDFFKARTANLFAEKGYRKDIIEAVLDIDCDSILEAEKKVSTLTKVSEESDFEEIVNLLKRVGNITKDYSDTEVDNSLMSEDAEKALYDFAIDFEAVSKQELENKNFEKYLKEILKGKKVINEFFDNIMVMDKDEAIRNNRLSLLKKLDILFKQVADITELD